MLAYRSMLLGVWLLVGFAQFVATSRACQSPSIDTPEKLWRDFRPDVTELEVETVQSWHEGQSDFEKLRFTAEKESAGRVRVFAIRGAPSVGTRLAGILHIHGGGQTASVEWVRFWVSRGYVCVSYDFTGPWQGRREYTDWGPITQANLAEGKGGLQMQPTPRASSWYHWAIAARHALTLLSYHPKVDRERLGVFGVSIGGTLSWVVAATDDRVKTAVPIYGCGHNFDPRKTKWGLPEPSTNLLLFNRVLAPEAYANAIRCPLLLLDATNDFHGWMDDAYEMIARVRGPARVAFTPRYNHHIDGQQGGNLPAWMDWQLRNGRPFPPDPKLSLRLDHDGVPLADVRPVDSAHVERVEVFYTLGEKPPPNRFWRRAETVKSERSWQARLPVLRSSDPLRAFANVTYKSVAGKSGVCLSTNLDRAIPDRLGKAHATLAWSASPVAESEPGAPFVFATANTDPNVSPKYFVKCDDASRPDAVCVNPAIFGERITFAILSHYIGDPACTGRDGQSLTFEYRGDFLDGNESAPTEKAGIAPTGPGFTIQVTALDWTPLAKTYAAHVTTKGPAISWQRVSLSTSEFVAPDGARLTRWRDLDKIELRGVASKPNPPRFARFAWAEK